VGFARQTTQELSRDGSSASGKVGFKALVNVSSLLDNQQHQNND